MFGQNPVRKQDLDVSGRLAVQAIFPTIQGEGPFAGLPATFVRLAGCNLRCWFCDTDFESKIDNVMEAKQVVAEVESKSLPGKLVVLTGGEPLRQNVLPFIDALTRKGFQVQIETAGTVWVEGLEHYIARKQVMLVCSPKTPTLHGKILAHCEHYKYIISRRDLLDSDSLPFASTQPGASAHLLKPLAKPPLGARVFVQPCDEGDPLSNETNRLRCTSIALKHGYRMSLQLHKILNVE